MRLSKTTAIALFLFYAGFCRAELTFESELGYQGTQDRSLGYLQPKISLRTEDQVWVDGNASSRTRLSFPSRLGGTREIEASIRSLNLGLSHEHWRLTGGFQEIPWGETFGLPVLDIVNPKDYRDPLLLDPSWVRLPVAALQGQLFLGRFTLQAIAIPIPRTNQFIEPGSSYDPTSDIPGISLAQEPDQSVSQFGRSSEYGGKASYLFEGGLDAGFCFLRHWNRNPVYRLQSTTLVPYLSQVNTFGNSLSYSWDRWVFRMDTALNAGQPLQNTLTEVTLGTQVLNAWGTDLSLDGGWILSAQFQSEFDWFWGDSRRLNWVSSRLSKSVGDGKFGMELFTLTGVGNSDLWFQPQVKYSPFNTTTLTLRGDLIPSPGNSSKGYLWFVRDHGRVLLWVTFKV